MGGACGSSCQAGDGVGSTTGVWAAGMYQGWREVSGDCSSHGSAIGAWGRRTGSGIPMNTSAIPPKPKHINSAK